MNGDRRIGKQNGFSEDPTENVKALVKLEMSRQDDLRAAESRRLDEQAELREDFGKQLREAESKRIDAIRAVDVAAVATANERATQQATVLANQVAASAETLRNLVASTASQVAANLQSISAQLMDRLTLLERSQYQIGGRDQQRDVGKVDVAKWVGWVFAAIGLAYAFILRGHA
jgi:cell wall-associated NlpC family hydrolase